MSKRYSMTVIDAHAVIFKAAKEICSLDDQIEVCISKLRGRPELITKNVQLAIDRHVGERRRIRQVLTNMMNWR